MSTPANDGGPAFPISEHGLQGYNGMSLRDWFAGQALPNVMSSSRASLHTINDVAAVAYTFADAMIAAREVAE